MICRETRPSGWPCQLSHARPMTAASFIRVYPRTTWRYKLLPRRVVRCSLARRTREKCLIHVIFSNPLQVESYFVQYKIWPHLRHISIPRSHTLPSRIWVSEFRSAAPCWLNPAPGAIMKIFGIKGYFDRIILVCDRVPISKQYMSSVISVGPYFCYWISREFCQSIAPLHYQIRTICKVMWLWKSDVHNFDFFINFTQYHLNRREIIQWNVYWKIFNDLFAYPCSAGHALVGQWVGLLISRAVLWRAESYFV